MSSTPTGNISLNLAPRPDGMEMRVTVRTDKGEAGGIITMTPLQAADLVHSICRNAGLPAPWRS